MTWILQRRDPRWYDILPRAMHRVFVYGTLMRGGMNNGLLRAGEGVANFFGAGVTTENWPLVVGTSAFVPFILDVRGRGMVSDRKAAATSLVQ